MTTPLFRPSRVDVVIFLHGSISSLLCPSNLLALIAELDSFSCTGNQARVGEVPYVSCSSAKYNKCFSSIVSMGAQ